MKTVVKILLVLGTFALLALLMALPVMWLWNWLMPKIFGLITINFWEALGLCLLTSALFKGSSNSDK